MSGIGYWILDTETTGLDATRQEVVEIGVIRVETKVQLWKNIKAEYPERSSWDALKICNKTLADLEKGDTKEQVIEVCEKFFSEDGLTPAHRCIIAHNASFDRKFLHALWGKVNKEFPAMLWVDSIQLVRAYAKKMGIVKPKVNLAASCDLLQVKKFANAHSAKSDTRNTYLLWKALTETHNIDPLPFIKTIPHILSTAEDSDNECGLDPALLDI